MKFNLNRPFKWGELNCIEFETKIGIDAYRVLNKNQEESLLLIKQKFEDDLKAVEKLDPIELEHQGSFYYQIAEREEMIIEELQRQQRYAICLSIFSFLEGRLKSICDKIEQRFEFKIKLDDLNKRNDLMRYWNYLVKIYEIDVQKITPFFTPLKNQKIVRNIIAHQDGIISKEQKGKINIVSGLGKKQIDNELRIEIKDTSYNIYLLEKIEVFFEKLLFAIDKRDKEKELDNNERR